MESRLSWQYVYFNISAKAGDQKQIFFTEHSYKPALLE